MGLFDKLKSAAQNATEGFQQTLGETEGMDLYELCDAYKELGMLDPKRMAYSAALTNRCNAMSDGQLEEFYQYIKKAGSLLKPHPGKDEVENVLVHRKLYIRNEDGTITKNRGFNFFKK